MNNKFSIVMGTNSAMFGERTRYSWGKQPVMHLFNLRNQLVIKEMDPGTNSISPASKISGPLTHLITGVWGKSQGLIGLMWDGTNTLGYI